MLCPQAAITAGFVITEVKKVDPYCGGPTQIDWLDLDNGYHSFGLAKIAVIEREIEAGTSDYKKKWVEKMEEIGPRIVEGFSHLKDDD